MDQKLRLIKKFLPFITATAFFLALALLTVAQAKFSTVVNEKQAALNDMVEVEYTIQNARSVEKITPPSFKNFRVVQGPLQSDGMSYMNGVISQYKSISYIIQPLVKGRLIVPGASAIIDGKEQQSQAVAIEVSESVSGRSRGLSPSGIQRFFPEAEPEEVDEEFILRPDESMTDKIKNNLIVKAEVNKTTCYEGEPIMATFKLCSRLRSESKVLKRPSLNGFSVFDMVEPDDNRPTVQTINGKLFNVHLIRQTQLFPLQPGTFTIDPVELENTVKFLRKAAVDKSPRSPMQELMEEMSGGMMRGAVEEQTFTLASKPITITVKPLPLANKPANFNGAVGKFSMKAHWKDKQVGAGEELLMQMKIEGKGNFTVINAPAITLPPGIEAYEPAIKEDVDKTVFPLSGSKTFDYTFLAKDTGYYTIPAISFTYFDPSDSRYKTERSDSINIHVIASGKKHTGKNKIASVDKQQISSYSKDLIAYGSVALAAIILAIMYSIYRSGKRRQPHPATSVTLQKIDPPKEEAPKKSSTGELLEGGALGTPAIQ